MPSVQVKVSPINATASSGQPLAAVYVRVSSEAQEDGSSLGTQEAACRQYAEQHGYAVAQVYREVFTGVELWERPRLTEMREAIRDHRVNTIICYAIDRLARDPVHLGLLITEADHADVAVEFVTEPLDNTPEGQLIRFVRGYAAKVEHEKIKERTARGRKARVYSGRPLPGPRVLYGYQWADAEHTHYEPNPTTERVVQRIFREAVSGGTLRHIAMGLTAAGVPPPVSGKRTAWGPDAIRWILHHPSYAGRATGWRDGKDCTTGTALPPGTIPALVDEATFDAVQERLRQNQLRSARNNPNPEATLLRGGYVRCGYCGRTMIVKPPDGNHGPRYRCMQCRSPR